MLQVDISHARDSLRGLFLIGVAAANPAAAVATALTSNPLPRVKRGQYFLIAVGKAAHSMIVEARRHLPDGSRIQAIAVTNYENHTDLPGVRCFAAGHPVPDENGLKAAQAVSSMVSRAREGDLVLALISGGGSALLPSPAKGLTLEDKAEVNRLLLASGAGITEMNLVRQNLSILKGGGLLRLAAPAKLRSLILSDVIGDDLRVIASGPTVASIGTRAEAWSAVLRLGIADALPTRVRHLLKQPDSTTFCSEPDTMLIGSNRFSLEAIAKQAGSQACICSDQLCGPVKEAARQIIDQAERHPRGTLLVFGGETTVVLQGQGKGGRNQELALQVALEADNRKLCGKWIFLSGGTDGRDGPTDAAGAIVDNETLNRLHANGGNVVESLANNDSYYALKRSGDLLMTGATGTNVADLQMFLKL